MGLDQLRLFVGIKQVKVLRQNTYTLDQGFQIFLFQVILLKIR